MRSTSNFKISSNLHEIFILLIFNFLNPVSFFLFFFTFFQLCFLMSLDQCRSAFSYFERKKKQSDESTNDLKSKLLSVSTSYRADVPDLQGFIVRRRHQQVGVGRPGHVRNALQVRRESFHCFYFLCNDVNQGGRRCQTRPGDDDTSA